MWIQDLGLQLRNLADVDPKRSMRLFKWLWRFGKERVALWGQVTMGKYGVEEGSGC